MLKKILMWLIYAGVVGLLIFGAVIRTQAKAGDKARPESKIEEAAYRPDNQGGEVLGNYGQGTGRIDRPSENGEEIHLAEDEEHDWISLSGVVTGLDAESLWIETDEGENLEFTRRVWRFIRESGLEISAGDQVELEGFYENGEFEISYLEDLTSGESLQIREDSGRPLWGGGKTQN
jgi:hypothetical protein